MKEYANDPTMVDRRAEFLREIHYINTDISLIEEAIIKQQMLPLHNQSNFSNRIRGSAIHCESTIC